jgi:hypothetical protein
MKGIFKYQFGGKKEKVNKIQASLGLPQTGTWNPETEAKYRNLMDTTGIKDPKLLADKIIKNDVKINTNNNETFNVNGKTVNCVGGYCAKTATGLMESVYGDEDFGQKNQNAWTLGSNLRAKDGYNIYSDNTPYNPKVKYQDFVKSLKPIDNNILQNVKEGDYVNMYYANSSQSEKALNDKNSSGATHAGVVIKDSDGKLKIYHNFAGKAKKLPLELLPSLKDFKIKEIVRPKGRKAIEAEKIKLKEEESKLLKTNNYSPNLPSTAQSFIKGIQDNQSSLYKDLSFTPEEFEQYKNAALATAEVETTFGGEGKEKQTGTWTDYIPNKSKIRYAFDNFMGNHKQILHDAFPSLVGTPTVGLSQVNLGQLDKKAKLIYDKYKTNDKEYNEGILTMIMFDQKKRESGSKPSDFESVIKRYKGKGKEAEGRYNTVINRLKETNNYTEYKKGGIHIKPENKGKFNATKERTGKSTEELTHSKNPVTKKRAVFAQNAAKWKHQIGGTFKPYQDTTKEKAYQLWKKTAPYNLYSTDDSNGYNLRGYWENLGSPKSWKEGMINNNLKREDDGFFHGSSVNSSTGEFLKPKNHPSVKLELDWYNSPDAEQFRKENKIDSSGVVYKYVPVKKELGGIFAYKKGGYLKDKDTYVTKEGKETKRGLWSNVYLKNKRK